MTLEENKQKLDHIEQLEQNWNGYGAIPIKKEIISLVRMFLPRFKVQPFIAPLAQGGLQLEWELNKKGHFLEIEINDPVLAGLYEKTKDEESKEMEIVVLDIPGLANEFCKNENLC